MLNLLANRKEFGGLAADPAKLWPAFESADAPALDSFLTQTSLPGAPRRVDFNAARGNYEARIFDEATLPVRRGSLHDLFNLLAWATFPASKRAINRIHNEAMRTEAAGKRGARRDFLTLLDEAGVIVLVEDAKAAGRLASRIREIRGGPQESYPGAVRDLLRSSNARIIVFGHALFESLVLRPQTLAKVGAFAVILQNREDADHRLAVFLDEQSENLHPSMFPSIRSDIVFEFAGNGLRKSGV